jgi:hypothetical protein
VSKTATYWSGKTGDWQVAANWSDGAPTTPSSYAIIKAAGTYSVSIAHGLEYHVGSVWLNGAGATLSIAGVLDLNTKLTASKGTLNLSGTINGGTVVANGGKISLQGGTLSGVTWRGVFDLSATGAKVTIEDSLKMTGADGTGRGTIKLSGSKGELDFFGTQTLDNTHLTFTTSNFVPVDISGGTLTLGSGASIIDKNEAIFQLGSNSALVNNGSIAIGKSAYFQITDVTETTGGTLTNNHKIILNGGGSKRPWAPLSSTLRAER